MSNPFSYEFCEHSLTSLQAIVVVSAEDIIESVWPIMNGLTTLRTKGSHENQRVLDFATPTLPEKVIEPSKVLDREPL